MEGLLSKGEQENFIFNYELILFIDNMVKSQLNTAQNQISLITFNDFNG